MRDHLGGVARCGKGGTGTKRSGGRDRSGLWDARPHSQSGGGRGGGCRLVLAARATLAYSTAPGEQRTVALQDGSRITLNTRTRITVRLARHAREVVSSRARHFSKSAKNAARPFTVRTSLGSARAVGTRFDVYLEDRSCRSRRRRESAGRGRRSGKRRIGNAGQACGTSCRNGASHSGTREFERRTRLADPAARGG